MQSLSRLVCSLALAAVALPAFGTLSSNLFVNGDFESTSNLRNTTTPDGVLPHRFSQTYDVGGWIAHWGPLSNPGGLGGFSLYNNPRNLAETGGNSQQTSGLGNFNRSVDPTNPNNHLLEAVMFRGTAAQWVAGPANQVPGPMEFSFDFMIMDGIQSYYPWGQVFVYGMNYLPPDNVTFFRDAAPGQPGATYSVLDPALNPGDGQMLFSFTYGPWIEGSTNGIDPPYSYLNHWTHYDTAEYLENQEGSPIEPDGTPDYQWWGGRTIVQNLTQTYPYYVVTVNPVVYDESDPAFWLYGGQITPGFVFGYDNFDLRVSVEDPFSHCDMNLDSLVNVQDINPFVQALGSTTAYKAYLATRLAALSLPNDAAAVNAAYGQVDPNQSGTVDVQDINHFVAHLATGGVDAASLAVIPEPASLTLLALGGLALLRRR